MRQVGVLARHAEAPVDEEHGHRAGMAHRAVGQRRLVRLAHSDRELQPVRPPAALGRPAARHGALPLAGLDGDRHPLLTRGAVPGEVRGAGRGGAVAGLQRGGGLGQHQRVGQGRLGLVVAPGHAGLDRLAAHGHQHRQPHRGGQEGAAGRLAHALVVTAGAADDLAQAFRGALVVEAGLALVVGLRLRLGRLGRVAPGREEAREIPRRGRGARDHLAREVGVVVGVRPHQVAAQEVHQPVAHLRRGLGRRQRRHPVHRLGGVGRAGGVVLWRHGEIPFGLKMSDARASCNPRLPGSMAGVARRSRGPRSGAGARSAGCQP